MAKVSFARWMGLGWVFVFLGVGAGSRPADPVARDSIPPLIFDRACDSGEHFTVAAVGDVLLHPSLQRAAARAETFTGLWTALTPLIRGADMAYANLEGPTAYGLDSGGTRRWDPGHQFDRVVYTAYPKFNYPPWVIGDLMASGFDVVSTANNHALDRGSRGVDRTVEALDVFGLAFTGTRARGESEATRPWSTVVERNGLTVTWIACTYGTNGEADAHRQVLGCFDRAGRRSVLAAIAQQRRLSDAVIVAPHWGREYRSRPTERQRELGRAFLDAGALAVIGNHPHVVQPIERHVTPDGRETLLAYSLGNFVSGQRSIARRSTIVLLLGLTRGEDGAVFLNGVRFVPALMQRDPTGGPTVRPVRAGPGLRQVLAVLPKGNLAALAGPERPPSCPGDPPPR